MLDVTWGGAFLAGLISFVSPCVLPLVPPYLCFLAGVSLDELTQQDNSEGVATKVIGSAVAFVLGFTTVFMALGATASVIGQTVPRHLDVLSVIAGLVIIVMGLHFLGLFRLGFLYREALRSEQGYPLRLVVPGWEGNLWVKWLRRIEVGDMAWHTREETSKYTDLMDDGRSRRFTWVMDAKSVITSPSPQAPMIDKGHNVLTGIAWSGRGTIERVDITLDGGKNWRTARIDGLRLPRALHRFYYEFTWNGEPLLLQSRAIDSFGYVQPTKNELRAVRGRNSIYHNNGIQTWHVAKSGEVENVEIS